MIKNAFYSILKALFVLKIFTSLPLIFAFVKKLRLISKSMTSQARPQVITIYIFSSILRGKGNQTMKLGQVI